MMTLEELLERLGGAPDRVTLETYITRAWIKPAGGRFEEIDLARAQLVHQLQQEINVGDDAMDVVLHLLDQLYGLHDRLRTLRRVAQRLPRPAQTEFLALLGAETGDDYTDL